MARRSKGDGTIFKAADGSWRARVTLSDGRRKEVRAATKAEADQKRKALLQRRDTTGIALGSTPTIGEWVAHWIEATAERHAKSTTVGYRRSLGYFSAGFKDIRLNRLTIEAVEQEYQRLADSGKAGSTRHQCHAILRASLKSAIQRGHITMNFASLVENKPTPDRPKTDSLSLADIERIESALEGHRLQARWMLALALGLRPSEARGLEWSHLNFKTGLITVGQQVQTLEGELVFVGGAKTDSGNRIIRMPEYLLEMFKAFRLQWLTEHAGLEMWSPDGQPHAWMFTQERKPTHPLSHDSDSATWARVLERAGLPHSRSYITRHTAATVLIAHGVDAHVVAEILGHKDAVFTQRTYTHALAERKEQAANILDAIYAKQSAATLSATL